MKASIVDRTTYGTFSLQTKCTPFQPSGRKLRERVGNKPCNVQTSSEGDRFSAGTIGDLAACKIPPKESEIGKLENVIQTGGAAHQRTG